MTEKQTTWRLDDGPKMLPRDFAKQHFKRYLREHFWLGVAFGAFIMCAADLTDFHLRACFGECSANADIQIGGKAKTE